MHHAPLLLGVTAESRTKAQRVLVVTGVYWENTHVPHRIDTTLDKKLIQVRQSSPYEPLFKDELGLQFH